MDRLMRGARRRPLTSKMGNKNYYKGSGSGPMGSWTQKGHYIIDNNLVRHYIVPNLEGCLLRPYVSDKQSVLKTRISSDDFQ